jgi:putative ATPase
MSHLGYGKGYRYAHAEPEAVIDQQHLPDELKGTTFYHPTDRGMEKEIAERLEQWRKLREKR